MTSIHAQPRLQVNEFVSHDPKWVEAQKNIFARWFNVVLKRARSSRTVTGPTLLKDLHDGVVLLQALQVMYPTIHLPRWFDPAPTAAQQLDNCTTLLRAVQLTGIRFEFVTPKNIVEGDEAPVMGLVWLMLKEFEIKEAIQKAHVLDELIQHDEAQHATTYVVPSPAAPAHQLASVEAKPPVIVIPTQTSSTQAPVAVPAAAAAAAAAVAAVDASVALSAAAPTTAAGLDAATAAGSAVATGAAASTAVVPTASPVSTSAPVAAAAAAPVVADATSAADAAQSGKPDGHDSWRVALLRWIQSRCAPYGVKCNTMKDINARVLLCIIKSLEPDAVKEFDVHDTHLSLQQLLDVAETKLNVPKLFEANEHVSEWAWSLYISMYMVYLPRRYNYLRGAYDKAISLLERLDAAHQGILTKIDDRKNHFEDSLTALSKRAKQVAYTALEERKSYLGSYFANSSLANMIAGPK